MALMVKELEDRVVVCYDCDEAPAGGLCAGCHLPVCEGCITDGLCADCWDERWKDYEASGAWLG